MKKDLDYIVRLEREIQKKYGKDAIVNPKSGWNEAKEKDYLEQLEKIAKKNLAEGRHAEKEEIDGFLVHKKLLNKETQRKCNVCEKYSFDLKDDIYMLKFDCCNKCYIQYVENREDRWLAGWRPNKEKADVTSNT
jgi:hypothetical protein